MATHYETLGVAPSASHAEIRTAFRRLARIDHPDRWAGRDPAAASAAAQRMVALNAAWRILGDPTARAAYDARLGSSRLTSQRADSRAAPRPATRVRPVAPPPTISPGTVVVRGLPWVAVLLILGVIFVVTAFAGGGSTTPAPPPTTVGAAIGDCVRFPGPTAVDLVDCSAPHEGTISAFVPIGRPCPTGQANVYLPDRGESACIARS